MKAHITTIHARIKSRAIKNCGSEFKVGAVGVSRNGTVIDIAVNTPRLEKRSLHAEEKIIFRNGKNLTTIYIARFNKRGKKLPIKPCKHCKRLAEQRGIKIREITQ